MQTVALEKHISAHSIPHVRSGHHHHRQHSAAPTGRPVDAVNEHYLRQFIQAHQHMIFYSDRSYDGSHWLYRHAIIPQELMWVFPTNRLLRDDEWPRLGLRMSEGWQNYMLNRLESNVLLFRKVPTAKELDEIVQSREQQLVDLYGGAT